MESKLSRRLILRCGASLLPASLIAQMPATIRQLGWHKLAAAATTDIVLDTISGLIAFVVPGPDPYSVAQGVSTPEPGGLDANILQGVVLALDASAPLPSVSTLTATALNGVALAVSGGAQPSGPFLSAFSNLSWAGKAAAFGILEGDPSLAQLRSLSGALCFLVAFAVYSEAGAFDFQTRTLSGFPVGWTISNYSGVFNGYNEFKGYYMGRTSATPSAPEFRGEAN
jgi:hypothetical protein